MGETRGKGEGSIYRRKDGRYVGSVECGRDRQGKLRRRRVVRNTRAEFVKGVDKLRRQVGSGVVPDATRRLTDYFTWWLDTVKSGRVKAGTVASYRGTCDRDIVLRVVAADRAPPSADHGLRGMAERVDVGRCVRAIRSS